MKTGASALRFGREIKLLILFYKVIWIISNESPAVRLENIFPPFAAEYRIVNFRLQK